MVSESLRTRAQAILNRRDHPRNESERYKRNWAKAVLESNQDLAIQEWNKYCRNMEKSGTAEM